MNGPGAFDLMSHARTVLLDALERSTSIGVR